jgi:replicative DNA helicase
MNDQIAPLNGRAISHQSTEPQPQARLMQLRDVLGDVRRDADAAHEARLTGKPRGAISNLPSLDRELAGAFAPGVHFIHGNAGAGKTAFALQVAADCQCPALFVTCEMAPAELLRRHTARVTRTFLHRLKSGEMSGADVERLTVQAIEAAPDLAFVDATTAPASSLYLLECAKAVKNAAPDEKHLLIVVDSLHSWTQGVATSATEYDSLNEGIGALKRLSALLDCAVLVVSERNRESMKGGDGINSGAGTRKIEYGAETIISLERDAKADEDGAGDVEVAFKLAKNRHGAPGKSIRLRFNGALQSFRDLGTVERCEAAVSANAARTGKPLN